MESLVFTFGIVAPVFLIVAVGYLLKIIGLMNENFINISSKIVFSVSLPALIFLELFNLDFSKVFEIGQIGYIYLGTLFAFAVSWFATLPFIHDGKDRGVFIQGSFRSNYAIVGLAILSGLVSKVGFGKASLFLVFMIPLYNTLAVIALTVPLRKEKKLNLRSTLTEIMKNPLILAVLISLPFAFFKIPIHPIFLKTGRYIADIALPLALINIGATLNFRDIKKASLLAFYSALLKLIIFPALVTWGAILLGYKGDDLAIIFILFACPTAVVSYIMAEAMGSNGKLAGNIVLTSTLGSVVTITLGLFILKTTGLI
jgi:hypothetical protein